MISGYTAVMKMPLKFLIYPGQVKGYMCLLRRPGRVKMGSKVRYLLQDIISPSCYYRNRLRFGFFSELRH